MHDAMRMQQLMEINMTNQTDNQILNFPIDFDEDHELDETQQESGASNGDANALDAWDQAGCALLLMKFFQEKWLDICNLDKLRGVFAAICAQNHQANRYGNAPVKYEILSGLHCVDYADMPPEIRSGLPAAVQQVLNLNDETGPLIFGPNWLHMKDFLANPFGQNEHKSLGHQLGPSLNPSKAARQAKKPLLSRLIGFLGGPRV